MNISVILPVESSKHKNFNELFEASIKSVENQIKENSKGIKVIDDIELVIVHSDEEHLVEIINNLELKNVTLKKVVNTGDVDFTSQINLGIENSSHDWLTILEFDDEIASIWFKNVQRYSEAYKDVKAFLPIVVDVDDKGVFAGFTNEATFAANMNSELGYLTNEVLLNYQNFQSSGMVIRKEIFHEYGAFKKNFKLTFVYEMLLRLTYNSVKIMTIPRIGYKHTNMREGSIFWSYKNGENYLSNDEVLFWIESAKKEHFFKEDREIKYEPEIS
jgi:hypothetical protein